MSEGSEKKVERLETKKNESIAYYEELKKSVQRSGGFLLAVCLIFMYLSRNPRLGLDTGIFDTGISSGFVIVYGPFILLGLIVWYVLKLMRCLKFRRHVSNLKGEIAFSEIDAFRLGYPSEIFGISDSDNSDGDKEGQKRLQYLLRRVPLYLAVAALCMLMSEYFKLSEPVKNGENSRWPVDIVFAGKSFPEGFHPAWDRLGRAKDANNPAVGDKDREVGRNMPWVIPPVNTVLYLGTLALVVFIQNCFSGIVGDKTRAGREFWLVFLGDLVFWVLVIGTIAWSPKDNIKFAIWLFVIALLLAIVWMAVKKVYLNCKEES